MSYANGPATGPLTLKITQGLLFLGALMVSLSLSGCVVADYDYAPQHSRYYGPYFGPYFAPPYYYGPYFGGVLVGRRHFQGHSGTHHLYGRGFRHSGGQ